MKGLSRVVIGSIAGGLLGAAAFFAVDGVIAGSSVGRSQATLLNQLKLSGASATLEALIATHQEGLKECDQRG